MEDKQSQLSLKAKTREVLGGKVKKVRAEGLLPAVLYGPKTKNLPLAVDHKEFEEVYKQAGESSIIYLEIEGKKGKFPVLIHEIQKDPLTDKIIHVDFYQPDLEKKVVAWVPLVIVGESPAVKNLGGTLVKNITEIEVKALPLNLPHEIKINAEDLKTFDDEILVKDLKVPEGVEILKHPDEVIISVSPPEKEEELPEEEEEIKEPELVEEEEKEEEKEEKETRKEEKTAEE
jgi:large subunit ribosomal protein L25